MAIEWTPTKITIFWVVVETLMLAAVAFGFYAVIHQSTSTILIDVLADKNEVEGDVRPSGGTENKGTVEEKLLKQRVEEDDKLIKDLRIDVESLVRIQRQSRIFGIIALVLYTLAFVLGSIVARALRIPFPT